MKLKFEIKISKKENPKSESEGELKKIEDEILNYKEENNFKLMERGIRKKQSKYLYYFRSTSKYLESILNTFIYLFILYNIKISLFQSSQFSDVTLSIYYFNTISSISIQIL